MSDLCRKLSLFCSLLCVIGNGSSNNNVLQRELEHTKNISFVGRNSNEFTDRHVSMTFIRGYILSTTIIIYRVFCNLWNPLQELIVRLKVMKKSHINICVLSVFVYEI